jgi:uncharacterized Ntn-hydrolase superfamily protein
VAEAGHYVGKNFSVQANLMLNDGVWPAMAQAFETCEGALAERMVAALEAAQAEGGDIRGKQSAAILVVKGEASGNIWEDRLIDLRIDDHPEPVKELNRLLGIFRAYEHMNTGEERLGKNDAEGAINSYRTAEAMQPDNLEMKFWYAVSLANAGRVEESRSKFREIFAQDKNWSITFQRIAKIGLLKVNPVD